MRALAEEHHWGQSVPHAVAGWQPPPASAGGDVVQPRALAAAYRALRKSYEDSSNAPGAADFYYGEMETRRADPRTPPAERGLLTAYWGLSGYGLRHSVIFRSSGKDLTTAGTYTEMASRLTEPVLLGLAVLAVRGRIKR
ncbi:hypothetical protein [Streptomyces sp. NPDC049040]|uniref:hypothetical protein n=1 Tax=Streptomyces sp. NPDC049040 TaxID=3365593 RepID=UPI0037128444